MEKSFLLFGKFQGRGGCGRNLRWIGLWTLLALSHDSQSLSSSTARNSPTETLAIA